MRNTKHLTKSVSITIILLCMSIAIIPSINFTVVKASTDNEFIEVTSEACGIKGFGNTTVKLTKQQYQDLQNYLVEFRARLNQTTTREEAVPIFKEAVVELNKYGLLPKGMSVEQAQKFVNPNVHNKFSNYSFKRVNYFLLENESNLLCLVAGQINNSYSINPLVNKLMYFASIFKGICDDIFSILISLLLIIDYILKPNWNFNFIVSFLNILFSPSVMLQEIAEICWFLSNVAPLTLLNVVGIGDYRIYDPNSGYHESNGWIQSFGLFGKKEWNGSLYGRLSTLWIVLNSGISAFSLPGMIGYSGIKITSIKNIEKKFYLGSALWVKIGSEPP